MAYRPYVKETFISSLDVPIFSDSSDDDSASPEDRLVPFECPPQPKLSRKLKYYSLGKHDIISRHAMTDWEKKAILSRVKKADSIDEADFQRRLSNVRARNDEQYISSVRDRAEEDREEEAHQREQLYLRDSERRDRIFFRHKNIVPLQQIEKYVCRARSWYNIIVFHVFLTALMQERKVQVALETFSFLMAPMVKRFVAIKRKREAARELTAAHMNDIPFPFPQVIQSMRGTFFQGWPSLLLEKLVSKATPMYLKKGSYLMHEGDLGRVMFMITTGTVSIILPKKGKNKRRCKENASGVFEVVAPCYVGEFALVCKEPRSASIYCETDIGYWAVLPEDYEDVVRHLSPEIASKQREATDKRRRENLQKFFPLKVSFLRKFTYFEKFSTASLEKVIASVEPIVLHDGDFLFEAGQMDSSAYFIQDGIAVHRDELGVESKVTTGVCVGMFECSCGVNEPKRSSIVSVNYCDIWRLRRDTIIDVGMSEPVALLHCRRAAKRDRALQMKKDGRTPAFIKNDPYLSFCLPPTCLSKFYELCVPTVYLNGERFVLMGQSVTSLVVLVNGVVDVTVAANGEQETSRMYSSEKLEEKRNSLVGRLKLEQERVHAHSRIIGAYEFAASISQYACTATSFGLTEALYVDKAKLDAILPPELLSIMQNKRGRDVILKAYKRKNISLLEENKELSYSFLYKQFREQEKEKTKQRSKLAIM